MKTTPRSLRCSLRYIQVFAEVIYWGTDIAYCAICGQDITYTYLIHRLSARIAILVILVPKVLILCEAGPRPLVPSVLILLRD